MATQHVTTVALADRPAAVRLAAPHRNAPARPPAWLLWPAAAAAAVALIPLWYLLTQVGSPAEVLDILATADTVWLVALSLALTAVVTAAASTIGIALAWLVTSTDIPGARFLRVALVLPLAIPSYICAFAWLDVAPSLAGFPGAALVLTLSTYPYVFLPVLAALRGSGSAQEDVAASLGLGRWAVVRHVTLPRLLPTATAGALLVALYALSDFGAVALMRHEVFTWVIYGAYRSGFDPTRAASLSLLLVALATALALAQAGTRDRARPTPAVGRPRPRTALGRARFPALIGPAVALVAGVGVPVGVIGANLMANGAGDAVDALRAVLRSATMLSTLTLSAAAALACVILAVPVGVLAVRFRSRFASVLESATYAGHALPGIVVAIAMVFVGVRLLRPIYQSAPMLVLAYVVLFLPLAVAAVRAAVANSPALGEDVARSLGLGRWAVLLRVTLPLAAPGVAAGAAMVLLTAMKELPATLLLHPTGTQTLATMLWEKMMISDYSSAAPYALAIIVTAALPALWLTQIGDRRVGRG